jgi:hypothetical protein
MFFRLFSSLLPDQFKPRSINEIKKPKIKYGFNTNIDFTYKDEAANIHSRRNGAFMSNEYSFYGAFDAHMVNDLVHYDGYRKDIIDPNGQVSADLARVAAKTLVSSRINYNNVVNYLDDYANGTNAVSLMYNLLRMYYMEQYKEIEYEPVDPFYDNGHLAIMNVQLFGDEYSASKLGNCVNYTPVTVVTVEGEKFDQLENPLGPSLLVPQGFNARRYGILARALGEFETDAPFGLAHKSPSLCSTMHLLGCKHREPDYNYTLTDIKQTIDDIVVQNRLYTDFNYAYAMIAQIMLSPIPRSVEAAAWYIGVQSIQMPVMHLDTGFMSTFRGGTPYSRQVDWMETYVKWRAFPYHMVHHSAVLNEATYVELGNMARADELQEVNRYNFAQISINGQNVVTGGLLQDMTLLAMRYGNDIELPYAMSPGYTRGQNMFGASEVMVPVRIKDIKAPEHYNITDSAVTIGQESRVIVTHYTPMLFPIFTYGVNVDGFYMNSMEQTVELQPLNVSAKNITFYEKAQFVKFMNMMRIAGFNVEAIDAMTQRKIVNWADNASGRFLYTDVQYEEPSAYHVIRTSIKKRDNTWMNIGDFRGAIKMDYKMDSLSYVVYNGKERLTEQGAVITTTKISEYHEKIQEIKASADMVTIRAFLRRDVDFYRPVFWMPGLSAMQTMQLPSQRIMPPGEDDNAPIGASLPLDRTPDPDP